MQPRKLQVGIIRFPYAGNGGAKSEIPEIGNWLATTLLKIKADPRTEEGVEMGILADTPITMTRNAALLWACQKDVDVLIMLDSDQAPDILLGAESDAKPFWDSSFDFLYRHWDKSPCCVGAPYLGPPPHPVKGGASNVYVFRWTTVQDDDTQPEAALSQYTREEAALSSGIHEVGALPTGCYMIDMRVINHLEPPWFHYEWKDNYQAEKASTEDVVFTRNASQCGVPQYCNWDAWAGHAKSWMTAKPRILCKDQVHKTLVKAVERGIVSHHRIVEMNPGGLVPEPLGEASSLSGGNGDAGVARPQFVVVQRKYGLDFGYEHGDGSIACNTRDDELDCLKHLVSEQVAVAKRHINILETGSWAGASAMAMRAGLAEGRGDIYCVDHWKGAHSDCTALHVSQIGAENLKKVFRDNVDGCENIHVIESSSEEAASNPSLPERFSVIFLDDEHTYRALAENIKRWSRRLDPDGILCGHDYEDDRFPGVTQAIKDILGEVHSQGAIWWIRAEEISEQLRSASTRQGLSAEAAIA